jgi:hypothetical protein
LDNIDQNQGADMKPSADQHGTAYYRADVQGLNPGDAATRTLDPQDGTEYTYATTSLDVARAIAAKHADFCVYHVALDEPIEADPDAVEDNLGALFVTSPSGTVADVVADRRRRELD